MPPGSDEVGPGSARRVGCYALVLACLGLAAVVVAPVAIDGWTEWRLNQRLRALAGEQEILGHWSGVWVAGSCCTYVVAAIALVPEHPAPSEVRVATRAGDLIDEGGGEGSPYDPSCRTCGTGGVAEAFAGTDAPDAQVWFLVAEAAWNR